MPFSFFVVPIRNGDEAAEALNRFLRAKRVLAVDRRWVEEGAESYWAFCVDWIEARSVESSEQAAPLHRNRIDYKTVLAPDEFRVYVALRDWRKRTAEAEAVPLFAVFSNQQMAEMVRRAVRSKGDLRAIAGIGDARIEKYADEILRLLADSGPAARETNGSVV